MTQRELVTVTTNAAHIIDIRKPVQLKGRENLLEVQRFQQCRYDFRCSALKHGYDFTENLLHTVSTDAHIVLHVQRPGQLKGRENSLEVQRFQQ